MSSRSRLPRQDSSAVTSHGQHTADARTLYIELLKRVLDGRADSPLVYYRPAEPGSRLRAIAARVLSERGFYLCEKARFDSTSDPEGRTWAGFLPLTVRTMVGRVRLDHLHQLVTDILTRNVPGDLIECGVWRGGSAILMRGLLAAYNDPKRRVWLADSFAGLPPPNVDRYPADEGQELHTHSVLAVSSDEVRSHFASLGLLDDRVEFVEGWFQDTLGPLAGHQWALIRLDGDMYESTIVALDALYGGLSEGGWIVIDDYGGIPACRAAVHDFRDREGISEPIERIDWTGACWQRSPRDEH